LNFFFTTISLFIHGDLSKPFILDMNVSDFVVGVIFSQIGKVNFFHLIRFYFCNFFPTEINCNIYDKEILAIMDAFEEWYHLFEGVQHEIIVYSSHKNL
jgi:hypothetical protein